MINVNSKILWLSDFDLHQAFGGAQRSDKILIDKGVILGHNILKLNHETYNDSINLDDYDVVVSSNFQALSSKFPDLVHKVNKHKYHVRVEHDSNAYMSQNDRELLFGGCTRTFFLSDYHHQFFKELYGDIFKNVEIVYDPIDTTLFYNKNQEREDKILYVGYMHELKGTSEFFEYALSNQDKQFVVAGFTDKNMYNFLAYAAPNIEYLGRKEHEEMPDVYNKYKRMFYAPRVREPFCRSVAEAMCCGVEVVGNYRHIGCVHEIQKIGIDEFKNKCNNAAQEFWDKI